jgi:ubiquinone biosynthesis protein
MATTRVVDRAETGGQAQARTGGSPSAQSTLFLRRFIASAAIAAGVFAAIVGLASVVTIAQPFPFGQGRATIAAPGDFGMSSFLLLGMAAVLANLVLRPLLLAASGPLSLVTFFVSSLLTNALVLWIVGSSLGITVLADPALIWMLAIAGLISIASPLAKALVGLDAAQAGEPEAVPTVWRALDGVGSPRRNALAENLRLQQVYDMLAATLVDILLGAGRLGRLRSAIRRRILGIPGVDPALAPQLRTALLLEQLGPTYVKIGQLLATRTDVLPPDWIAAFKKLQSDATPFPWAEAAATIRHDLGSPPNALFATFDRVPIAAASTAQVHRATLPDGTLVAVKVQRPNILAKTRADLGLLQQLARIAERHSAFARRVSASAIVKDFAGNVLQELDYRNEAYFAQRLADGMRRFPDVHVVAVFAGRSSERVLTEEFVDGIKLTAVDRLRAAGLDPQTIGEAFVRAIVKQVLIDGFFHGDPHPGNVLVEPATGRIVFIDLGQVGRLDQRQRLELLALIHAIRTVQIDEIADGLLALGKRTRRFEEAPFRDAVERLAQQHLVYGTPGSLAEVVAAVISTALDHGLRFDPNLTIAVKAILQAEDTTRLLAPRVDVAAIAEQEAAAALREAIRPGVLRGRLEHAGFRFAKQAGRSLPSAETMLGGGLRLLGRGRLTVEVATPDVGTSVVSLGRQVAASGIVIGQLIGTAIGMAVLLQPAFDAFQAFGYVAMAGFVVALAVSFVLLRRLFRVFAPDDEE